LMIARELDVRLDPELRLAISRLDMDVHPLLLSRKEEEPERAVAKHRRTHPNHDAKPTGAGHGEHAPTNLIAPGSSRK
jgi:hypothetical protein